MAVATYTKSGGKATTSAKLDAAVFNVEVKKHDLLKSAYVAHQANARENFAVTKTRGLVRGGGKKPWRQKGTGRARFGSTRNPIWRTGGIVFGPSGEENYSKQINTKAKRQAIRQALSHANQEGRIKVIETFECKEGKVAHTKALLKKMDAHKNILIVVSVKDELVERATRNLPSVKAASVKYLNVYDLLNADTIIISQKSLDHISNWLGKEAK